MMGTLMILPLVFNLIQLCLSVESLEHSFLQHQILSSKTNNVNDLLGLFYQSFNTDDFRESKFRHILINGASPYELQQVQTAFETYPNIICSDAKFCDYSSISKTRSFTFFFLTDISENTIKRNLEIMSVCGMSCDILFIYKGIVRTDDFSFIQSMIFDGSVYFEVAQIEIDVVKMYRPTWLENCTTVVREYLVWRRGTKFHAIHQGGLGGWMRGCPVLVGTLKLPPTMMIEENEKGLPVIVGGSEGNLLLIIAEKLNFSIVLTFPPENNGLRNYSRKREIVRQVASGLIDIAIVRLGLNGEIQSMFSPSHVYDTECLTWGVPLTYENSLNILWAEFDWRVWILIASVFVITAVIKLCAHHKISSSINDNPKKVKFMVLLLDLISLNLGNNVIHLPVSKGGRCLLLIGLFYALIITTAYRSSLGSILTAVKTSPAVNDMEGIVKLNLSVGGSYYNLNILKDQAEDNDLVSKLVEKYLIYNNPSEAIEKLHSEHNFAYLSRSSNLYYEKLSILRAGNIVNFTVLQECVLNYRVVIILRKDHFLQKPINQIINSLRQSGIMDNWQNKVNNEILDSHNTDIISKAGILNQKFYSFFYLYSSALVLCSLVFFAELFSLRFQPKNRRQHTIVVQCNR